MLRVLIIGHSSADSWLSSVLFLAMSLRASPYYPQYLLTLQKDFDLQTIIRRRVMREANDWLLSASSDIILKINL